MVTAGDSGTLLQIVIAFKSMTLVSGETTGDKADGIPSSNGGSPRAIMSGLMFTTLSTNCSTTSLVSSICPMLL